MKEVKKLKKIIYEDLDYYIDTRLQEFRTVKPPLVCVPFCSKLGQAIKIKIDIDMGLWGI